MINKRFRHGMTDLVGGSAVFGIGAYAISKIPGGSAYSGGLSGAASMLPVAGTVFGAGMALNALKNFVSIGRIRNKKLRF